MQIAFDNSYSRLPDRFFVRLDPSPVSSPSLIKVNKALAAELGLDAAALAHPEGVAVLAGNAVPLGAAPLAQAYAGHQFGGWVPQLGDGRAILLGEVLAPDGARFDLQLKGSGPTPYSRMGDGRAWLGPVMREYIVSEAMHAFGVPTTRALAAVTTGEIVLREAQLPGRGTIASNTLGQSAWRASAVMSAHSRFAGAFVNIIAQVKHEIDFVPRHLFIPGE